MMRPCSLGGRGGGGGGAGDSGGRTDPLIVKVKRCVDASKNRRICFVFLRVS